jgi:hypothetical protein
MVDTSAVRNLSDTKEGRRLGQLVGRGVIGWADSDVVKLLDPSDNYGNINVFTNIIRWANAYGKTGLQVRNVLNGGRFNGILSRDQKYSIEAIVRAESKAEEEKAKESVREGIEKAVAESEVEERLLKPVVIRHPKTDQHRAYVQTVWRNIQTGRFTKPPTSAEQIATRVVTPEELERK